MPRQRAGDQLELEAFCHAQHGRLVRLLTLHSGDVETARDLAQEALVKICLHWRKVRRMDVPEAWVTRVALNLAASHWRKQAVRGRHERSLRTERGWYEDSAETAAVRSCVAALPERQRTAVILRYFEDLSVAETADLMGVSSSAVKKLAARGVDRLRSDLGTDIEEVPHA